MANRFVVEVCDFGPQGRNSITRKVHNCTLPKAWKVAMRAARKGAVRFGGSVTRSNWGARGGQFPRVYRSATIYASGYR